MTSKNWTLIGTDPCVQNFVVKTCRTIIDDVKKLDCIEDVFIHYHLLRFCQTTRLQHIKSHIFHGSRCVLEQEHVDCKITDTVLKKGTTEHSDDWDDPSKSWSHMVSTFRIPSRGGFGVTFNDVTKDDVFYTTTSLVVAQE